MQKFEKYLWLNKGGFDRILYSEDSNPKLSNSTVQI